jgi:N-carbamoylputrescine amidase
VARALALAGAEILLYPTAIGSEPRAPGYSSYLHWARAQLGHAAANITPLIVSNRIGTERGQAGSELTFYGGSFIAGPAGEVLAQVGGAPQANGGPDAEPSPVEGFAMAELDLDAIARMRRGWGVFRDRRPELYASLLSLDGRSGGPPH